MNQVVALFVLACAGGAACSVFPTVTPFTEILNDIHTLSNELKKHFFPPQFSTNPNDPFVQYLMIINTLNRLITNPTLLGVEYYEKVNQSISETISNPQQVADKLRSQLDKTSSKFAALEDLIKEKQKTDCMLKSVLNCDMIIDTAIKTSNDDLLNLQAGFFKTIGKAVKEFLNLSKELNEVANTRAAVAFLYNGQTHLQPLIHAAGDARTQEADIPPK